MKDESMAEDLSDGSNRDSAKFNSDWDSLVDSHLKFEQASPMYSAQEFGHLDFRPFGIVLCFIRPDNFLGDFRYRRGFWRNFSLIFFLRCTIVFSRLIRFHADGNTEVLF